MLTLNVFELFFLFLVKAMAITFAILAQGSAFWHGSETVNGGAADVIINDLFAYVAYQAVMRKVVPLESSIIHDLSLTPRASNGNQITSDSSIDGYIRALKGGCRCASACRFNNRYKPGVWM